MKVFVLFHSHQIHDDEESSKLIGVYSTRELAKRAIQRKSQMPGFRETRSGFHIDEYTLDKDYWTEGFITIE